MGGFGLVTADNVFKVCDQPHPLLVASILKHCQAADLEQAYRGMKASGAPPCLLLLLQPYRV